MKIISYISFNIIYQNLGMINAKFHMIHNILFLLFSVNVEDIN